LPGWKRFPEAQAWLDEHRPPTPQVSAQQADFDQFLAQRAGGMSDLNNQQQRDALFREFLQWRQTHQHAPSAGG